ncbi:hypothetical protein M2103_000714 [Ereboglobus sp. PH5-5]|nr:hypothetical protein [Ereboglobus sp. PH5-5]
MTPFANNALANLVALVVVVVVVRCARREGRW